MQTQDQVKEYPSQSFIETTLEYVDDNTGDGIEVSWVPERM